MSRTHRRLLLAGVTGVAVALLLVWVLFLRPTARANRMLRSAGLGRLPESACELHVKRRGFAFGTASVYVRFQTTVEDANLFFEQSRIDPANEPTPMRTLHHGSRSPAWMHWDTSVNGRMYHISGRSASAWLAIDDDSHTVYVSLHESQPAWFRRLVWW
jgi:hypothetical protein